MRVYLVVYLVVYFALVIGAFLALLVGDVISRLPLEWVVVGLLAALALGGLLAVVSRQRTIG